ncbi:CaaX prenyl protease [Purpureocillium lilacinum]|uniref:Ste24 endopeptidase n=1 Tax=Purpureocillium lilacinum TaxID=33203 RepID=A0A179HEV7_PURLI|nr:CaaX prenyl protease [Purpureocillium lilacinum]OAQ88111.1 CaaX prenyl protease [Purpureocillium lilacinum]
MDVRASRRDLAFANALLLASFLAPAHGGHVNASYYLGKRSHANYQCPSSSLQRLARFLDRPLFPWKRLILGFSVGQYLFETFLTLRQYRVLQAPKPPAVLAREISQETFDKSQAYGRAKARFEIVSGLVAQLQNVAFIQFDVLPKMWAWTGDLLLRWAPARFSGEISHSIVFIFSFIVLQQALSLPTRLYHTFVLEESFGFNKQTPKLFVTDLIKTQALTAVFMPPILAAFLKIIQKTGSHFVFYLWIFTAGLQVFITTAYPVFIQPLFNKLSPLEDGELKTNVEALAAAHKFPLKELFVIDGSKRSAHSNAYFYGLPWKKHIVIYDTLIEKTETQEIIAILAHELGHWKLGHTTRLFGISQVHLLYIFSLFSIFINNASLYASFGFTDVRPIVIGFLLFSDALSPMDSVIKLLLNILSRRFEFEADDFAKRLGFRAELATSLIKIHAQNLSTMDADWVYASYHFSHPHLSERLKALDWKPSGEALTSAEKDKDQDGGAVKATGREEL